MLFRSDRKSTRLNSSHTIISYAVFCLKKKNVDRKSTRLNSSHTIISYAVFSLEKHPDRGRHPGSPRVTAGPAAAVGPSRPRPSRRPGGPGPSAFFFLRRRDPRNPTSFPPRLLSG